MKREKKALVVGVIVVGLVMLLMYLLPDMPDVEEEATFTLVADTGAQIIPLAVYENAIFTGHENNQYIFLGAYESTIGTWEELNLPIKESGCELSCGVTALAVYDGKLFTGHENGMLGTYKDGAWSSLGDVGDRIWSFAVYDGNLFTSSSTGVFGTYKDGTWTSLGDVGSGFSGMVVYNGKIYGGDTSGFIKAYSNGTMETVARTTNTRSISAIAVHDGNIFVADWGTIYGKHLATYDPTSNVLTDVNAVDSVIRTLISYDGKLYTGHIDGMMGYYDTSTMQWVGVQKEYGEIVSFAVHDGNLFIGYRNGVLGTYGSGQEPMQDFGDRLLLALGLLAIAAGMAGYVWRKR